MNGAAQAALHERAAAATRQYFGKKVFVRAVVEVSNFCRENCAYCGMRRDNRTLARYRAQHEQIAELLIHHRPASVTDVNIQAGEDPVAVREVVLPLIETLRRETSLGISVCLGTLTPELYDELQTAGASIFIMKFECGDAAQYEQLEAPGTLAERLRHIRTARGKWLECQLRFHRRFAGANAARPGEEFGTGARAAACAVAASARSFPAKTRRWPEIRRRMPTGLSIA